MAGQLSKWKGTSRFKITWSEKHFEIRDGVSKSGGLFAPNLGQFDVILDGPEAVVKRKIRRKESFQFLYQCDCQSGCDLKLEFDGTKYAPLKLKGSTTACSDHCLILLLIYCLKYRGKEAKSGRTLRKTLTEPSVVGTEKKRSLSTAEPSVVLVQTKRVSTKTPTAKAIPKTSVKIKSAKVATRKNALDHRDPPGEEREKEQEKKEQEKLSKRKWSKRRSWNFNVYPAVLLM
uniref:Uncharacterized protein n=1 Tax=Ditylenchus dipsaci TaxID=166011 RepID=A0A915CVY5_9BILA